MGCIRLFPSVLYFILCVAIGCLIPYMSLILEAKDLSKLEIGISMAIMPLVQFISSPIGGFLFDRSGESKILWITYILATGTIIQFLLLTNSFLWVTIVCALFSFAYAPIMPLSDHSVLNYLGERKKEFGKYRLWGAVSYGIVALILGIILTYYPLFISFIAHFISFSVFALFIAISTFQQEIIVDTLDDEKNDQENMDEKLIYSTKDEAQADVNEEEQIDGAELEGTLQETTMQIFLRVFFTRNVLVFYFDVLLMGIGTTLIFNFLFLYLDELGGTKTLIGLSMAFTVSTEIPFFYYSDKFLVLFGEEWLILAAMVAFIIRVVGYSFLQNPWWVLPLELMHGLTFGAMYAAGVNYSSNLFPPKLAATGQGIFAGIYIGLGPCIGSLLGGWLYESYGARIMYRVMASIIGVGALILIINFWNQLYYYASNLPSKFQKEEKTQETEMVELVEQEESLSDNTTKDTSFSVPE